jgi:hypothetical protein
MVLSQVIKFKKEDAEANPPVFNIEELQKEVGG